MLDKEARETLEAIFGNAMLDYKTLYDATTQDLAVKLLKAIDSATEEAITDPCVSLAEPLLDA